MTSSKGNTASRSQSVSLKSRGKGGGGKSAKETMIQLKALEKKLVAKIENISGQLSDPQKTTVRDLVSNQTVGI